jgi:hypothetical protein
VNQYIPGSLKREKGEEKLFKERMGKKNFQI